MKYQVCAHCYANYQRSQGNWGNAPDSQITAHSIGAWPSFDEAWSDDVILCPHDKTRKQHLNTPNIPPSFCLFPAEHIV